MPKGYLKPSQDLKDSLFLSERRMIVAELYLVKGMTQQKIAAQLGVSQVTISNDVRSIKEEYSMKRLNKYQSYLNIELAKLDAVERESWAAWERSIGRSERVVTKTDAAGDVEETVTVDELVGDPRFLTQVQAAIDRRIRLLGLDAPQEVILNTMEARLSNLIKEGKVTFDMLIDEVGLEQARRYFNLAGAQVPDIVEGDIIEIEQLPGGEDGTTS